MRENENKFTIINYARTAHGAGTARHLTTDHTIVQHDNFVKARKSMLAATTLINLQQMLHRGKGQDGDRHQGADTRNMILSVGSQDS